MGGMTEEEIKILAENDMDKIVAEVMWKSDAHRPCLWSELDDDEQAEWVTMARAAMSYIRQTAAYFCGTFTFPEKSNPLPRDVIGIAKIIALESIQNSCVNQIRPTKR